LYSPFFAVEFAICALRFCTQAAQMLVNKESSRLLFWYSQEIAFKVDYFNI